MSPRYGLLLVLPFAGEIISAAYVRQGYDEAVASFLSQKWHSQNEWWAIDRWIELMAFTDAPKSIIDCVEKCRINSNTSTVSTGSCTRLVISIPPNRLRFLTALAGLLPDIAVAQNYINACAQIGSAEAARHLVTVACRPPADPSNHHNFGLARVLAVLLAKYPDVRQELLARAVAERGLAVSPVMSPLLRSIIGPDDIPTLVHAWDARGGDPASQILEQAVHNLSHKDRSVGETGAFEREPLDLSALRAELFRIYVDQEPQAAFAAKLLRIIDSQRDAYGRPLSEPRHPNLALDVPWPREAAGLPFLLGDGEAAGPP